jgi:hypothetical protein
MQACPHAAFAGHIIYRVIDGTQAARLQETPGRHMLCHPVWVHLRAGNASGRRTPYQTTSSQFVGLTACLHVQRFLAPCVQVSRPRDYALPSATDQTLVKSGQHAPTDAQAFHKPGCARAAGITLRSITLGLGCNYEYYLTGAVRGSYMCTCKFASPITASRKQSSHFLQKTCRISPAVAPQQWRGHTTKPHQIRQL